MKKKLTIGIIFGGRSAEHDVSLRSAQSIYAALDTTKYNPVLIAITKSGRWLFGQKRIELPSGKTHAELVPSEQDISHLDVVFPVLHGPYGEDGTVQGLLKLMNIPFVGAGVLGSAVGMDKDSMKRLLRDAGIPIGRFKTITKPDELSFSRAKKQFGLPLFIKPANLGSSVGVSKVSSKKEYDNAIRDAFSYDRKVLVEEFIDGREIEVSILGNDDPSASLPGEIIPTDQFYSYDEKYSDTSQTHLIIPADVSPQLVKKIQQIGLQTFKVLSCEGMARVDMFLKQDGKLYINEINTIPGFTSVSMYPKLWEASGLSYPDLIDRLIQLALERHNNEQKLLTSR